MPGYYLALFLNKPPPGQAGDQTLKLKITHELGPGQLPEEVPELSLR